MAICFPEIKHFKYEISDEEFLAAWHVFAERQFGQDGREASLPRLPKHNGLQTLIDTRHIGVDYLCRLLVPPSLRDTCQASNNFMALNAHLLEHTTGTKQATQRTVLGVRLIAGSEALERYYRLSSEEQTRLRNQAEAIFESDLEAGDEGSENIVTGHDLADEVTLEQVSDKPVQLSTASTYMDCARALAEWIEQAPYTRMYRGRPFGEPVHGWGNRLQAYFWPNPQVGYAETAKLLAPMSLQARQLADSLMESNWTAEQEQAAINLANDIFRWGGVKQRNVTAAQVAAVFRAALTLEHDKTIPMNSGWTKVAAFATEHLETQPETLPQVIWDSRVANAVTGRLDTLLHAAGWQEVPEFLADLGTVPGRGGTRGKGNKLQLRWPVAYGRWKSQIAGSQFVRAMRDTLNQQLRIPMPLPDGGQGQWTVRGVEMVLFGDGY